MIASGRKPPNTKAALWSLGYVFRERLEPLGSRQHYWCAAGREKAGKKGFGDGSMALGVIYRSSGSSSPASEDAILFPERSFSKAALPANACLVRDLSYARRANANRGLALESPFRYDGGKSGCLCPKFGWMSQNIGASYVMCCASRLRFSRA